MDYVYFIAYNEKYLERGVVGDNKSTLLTINKKIDNLEFIKDELRFLSRRNDVYHIEINTINFLHTISKEDKNKDKQFI